MNGLMSSLSITITPDAIAAFLKVLVIDLMLAGDNAVIIALAAAGLPVEHRRRAILIGIIAATALRILFGIIAIDLLAIVGLLLVGGVLLLWVCWKMWRELREVKGKGHPDETRGATPSKTVMQAAWQIVLADISMSLDNVLAVAGAARDHMPALVFGLALSIVLMGIAADVIARLLNRYRWIAYLGLAIILFVACDMIWRGAQEVWPRLFN